MTTHKTRPDYVRKRGDSYIPIEETFRGEPPASRPISDGDPLDLSDALSVRFYLEHTTRDETIVNDVASVDDPETGAVSYQLETDQLSRTGTHAGVFVARFEDNQQWSAPRGNQVITIQIVDVPDADGDPGDIEKADVSIGVLEADEVIGDSGGFGELSVSNAPVDDTDVLRKADQQDLSDDVTQLQTKTSSLSDDGSSGNFEALEISSQDVATKDYVDTRPWEDLTDWNMFNPFNAGYPGDGSGGDLMDYIRDLISDYDRIYMVLPGGTYNVESELNVRDSDLERLVIDGRPKATLNVNGRFHKLFETGDYEGGNAIESLGLYNLDIDITGDSNDCGIGRITVENSLDIENIRLIGKRDRVTDTTGDRFTLLCQIASESGHGTVRNVHLRDGSVPNGYENNEVIGFSADPGHHGTIDWIGCEVHGFNDNGVYVNGSPGSNRVIGGLYQNNAKANVRIGRNDTVENVVSIFNLGHVDGPARPDGWDLQMDPNLLDVDDSNGATSVQGAKLINLSSTNSTISARENVETLRIADIEVYHEVPYEVIRITSSRNSIADDNYEYRSYQDNEGTVRIEGGLIYDVSNDSVKNSAIDSNVHNVVVDGITYICKDGGGEQYRAAVRASTDRSKITIQNSNIISELSHGAVCRVDTGGTVNVVQNSVDCEYYSIGSGGNLRLVDNDEVNSAIGHYDDPANWAANFVERGNF
ncbi:BppU family phage baseplate upper protein [Haloterrigena sp. SYSU A558-1]|uniref:BppU family phage baseplate upper protein n=1 Tax=Haloterrigena gelatinilytica TaxID=2741724 RepID=A0ABX2L8K8_9EURY|nr:BppU family phage baseplate upper protein [Haloterrigena gelatinilytica]NUC71720.1 BppU family phage baseplate upper protein [Haloterrigena gelatinilytica]